MFHKFFFSNYIFALVHIAGFLGSTFRFYLLTIWFLHYFALWGQLVGGMWLFPAHLDHLHWSCWLPWVALSCQECNLISRNTNKKNLFYYYQTKSFLMLLISLRTPTENIKKWWIWGYCASPIMYVQNAIVVNEFLGKSWRHVIS